MSALPAPSPTAKQFVAARAGDRVELRASRAGCIRAGHDRPRRATPAFDQRLRPLCRAPPPRGNPLRSSTKRRRDRSNWRRRSRWRQATTLTRSRSGPASDCPRRRTDIRRPRCNSCCSCTRRQRAHCSFHYPHSGWRRATSWCRPTLRSASGRQRGPGRSRTPWCRSRPPRRTCCSHTTRRKRRCLSGWSRVEADSDSRPRPC